MLPPAVAFLMSTVNKVALQGEVHTNYAMCSVLVVLCWLIDSLVVVVAKTLKPTCCRSVIIFLFSMLASNTCRTKRPLTTISNQHYLNAILSKHTFQQFS